MADTQSLPLYVQISEMLIRDIQAGHLLDGERLPPERDMAADLGISVGTLRKALTELTQKGMLQRLQGSGNYVRHRASADSVYSFFRLELASGGGLPTARVLSVATLPKPVYLPDFGRGDLAHRIRRLRLLSGQPAALEEIWLDASYKPSLEADELSESLYLFYKTRLGLWIQRIEDRIGVAKAPVWSEATEIGFAGVMGLVDRISWDQSNQTAEVSRTWFDSENVRYISRLK